MPFHSQQPAVPRTTALTQHDEDGCMQPIISDSFSLSPSLLSPAFHLTPNLQPSAQGSSPGIETWSSNFNNIFDFDFDFLHASSVPLENGATRQTASGPSLNVALNNDFEAEWQDFLQQCEATPALVGGAVQENPYIRQKRIRNGYKCGGCPKVYDTAGELNKHFKRVHIP